MEAYNTSVYVVRCAYYCLTDIGAVIVLSEEHFWYFDMGLRQSLSYVWKISYGIFININFQRTLQS